MNDTAHTHTHITSHKRIEWEGQREREREHETTTAHAPQRYTYTHSTHIIYICVREFSTYRCLFLVVLGRWLGEESVVVVVTRIVKQSRVFSLHLD